MIARTKANFNLVFRLKLFSTQMLYRKIKPQRVEKRITDKLKSANLIHKFEDDKNNNISISITKQQNQPKQKQQVFSKLNESKANIQQSNQIRKFQNKKLQRKKQIPQENNKIQQYQPKPSVKKLEQALKTLGEALDPMDPKQLSKTGKDQMISLENDQINKAVAQMKSLSLKDFSILTHRLLVNSSGTKTTVQKYIWKEIQDNFLARFQVTTDPNQIRSYSKLIYCLAKSKVHKDQSSTLTSTSVSTNLLSFQTKFALLLPSATHQSFTTIVTSLSRMGPLSQQFSYIVERLYYSKYDEFNVRQKVQINYALTRNGRGADSKLINFIDSMNLNQILIMLRCFQNSGKIQNSLLTMTEKHIIGRKNQMNIIDIGDLCAIYFQYTASGYNLSKQMEKTITEMYSVLRKNINEVTFDKIWKNLPQVVNRGFLEVNFMQDIIKTVRILRKKNLFPERLWKPLKNSFKQFNNLQIRARLEEIR